MMVCYTLAVVMALFLLTGKNLDYKNVHIYCQSLDNYGEPEEYIDFVTREHQTLVDRTKLVAAFEDTLKAYQSTAIPVMAFYAHKFEDFIKQGCHSPPSP